MTWRCSRNAWKHQRVAAETARARSMQLRSLRSRGLTERHRQLSAPVDSKFPIHTPRQFSNGVL